MDTVRLENPDLSMAARLLLRDDSAIYSTMLFETDAAEPSSRSKVSACAAWRGEHIASDDDLQSGGNGQPRAGTATPQIAVDVISNRA